MRFFADDDEQAELNCVVPNLYYHGDCEKFMGRDLVISDHMAVLPVGVHPVEVMYKNNVVESALAFVWSDGTITKGVIVYGHDLEAVQYACEKYAAKAMVI